jgi:hypothetical protein
MSNYARLSKKQKHFQALTGYTLEEFQGLVPAFEASFLERMETYTLEGKRRRKRCDVIYCNSPLPAIEDKLVLILMYLRKATRQDIFGEVYQMPQPVANKWIHVLHPCLNQALGRLEEKPARQAENLHLEPEKGQLFFLDGTELPCRGRKTRKSRALSTAARKNTIASRTMC